MRSFFKSFARVVARSTIGRLPPPVSRLTGRLAMHGGKPVRDVRLRPWVSAHRENYFAWFARVGPALRRIFLSGIEGLPQRQQIEFAERWAKYCSCKHALLLPHGTDALRFALSAVLDHDGLDYGGEVIVPNYTFIASATCALDRRFGVAFVDVDSETLNLDPARVEEAVIPGKTRAVVAVHQFGQPANMSAIQAIAQRHHLKIIEDAAQAHGAQWETGPVGSLGDAAGFSFQSSKNLTCGEGGILTTNDSLVFTRAYSLHNAGRVHGEDARWEHETLGWNCRPTEYQAALLLYRLRNLERKQEVRAQNFCVLRNLLRDVRCVKPLAVHSGVRRHAMYMFVMRYQSEFCDGLGIEEFLRATTAEGMPLNRCYTSTLANQPVMRKLRDHRPEYVRVLPTPVADAAATEMIYIPGSFFLGTQNDMEDVAAAIRKVERYYAKGN